MSLCGFYVRNNVLLINVENHNIPINDFVGLDNKTLLEYAKMNWDSENECYYSEDYHTYYKDNHINPYDIKEEQFEVLNMTLHEGFYYSFDTIEIEILIK